MLETNVCGCLRSRTSWVSAWIIYVVKGWQDYMAMDKKNSDGGCEEEQEDIRWREYEWRRDAQAVRSQRRKEKLSPSLLNGREKENQ